MKDKQHMKNSVEEHNHFVNIFILFSGSTVRILLLFSKFF